MMTGPVRDRKLILIADDESMIRMLSRESLEQEGYAVEEAEDGNRAFELFQSSEPDLVLLDVLMPGMNGFEVCRKIRSCRAGELVPIVIITGLHDVTSIQQAYEAGATHFVTKPISWHTLSYHIRYVLRSSTLAAELKRHEQQTRAILGAMPDALFSVRRDGTFVGHSGSLENLLLPPAEFIGRRIEDVLPEAVATAAMGHVKKAFANSGVQVFEYQLPTGGENRNFEARIAVSGPDEALILVRDVTDRELRRENLIRAEKISSLGTLAGGIAHDFNNLLQGVFGYISLARMAAAGQGKICNYLEQAEKALSMTSSLTGQLLTFSKGGQPVKKTISIGPLVRNASCFALSGSVCSLDCEISDDLWNVEADEGQIGQVIQNLVLNAMQAMPLGGIVKVRAENRDLAPGQNVLHPDGGQFIVVDVSDTGTGIAKDHLTKIFDPYFTTKQKGSGLGLATAFSIVKKHGGAITVDSQLGVGSTFSLYLPAIAARAVAEQPKPALQQEARHGRVLVMDDDAIVRESACGLIEALGHEVQCAIDGEEAIAKIRRSQDISEPFDVIILDLTIRGGMGGEEAIRKIREMWPNLKVVVSSGYADDPVIAHYQSYGFDACLGKPYMLESLRECFHILLKPAVEQEEKNSGAHRMSPS